MVPLDIVIDKVNDLVLRSARSASSAPGYWILTATSRPSAHTPLCTCPMLAEATGASSNDWKRSRQRVPSWPWSTRCARRYRTVKIRAGNQILTAAEPLPEDLRAALVKIRADGAH
jgi:hypothetical protein